MSKTLSLKSGLVPRALQVQNHREQKVAITFFTMTKILHDFVELDCGAVCVR